MKSIARSGRAQQEHGINMAYTAYRSLIFLFGLSNVFSYVKWSCFSNTRYSRRCTYTYFYVHPWSTQALQCPARLDPSTAPTCVRPPAHTRAPSYAPPTRHTQVPNKSSCDRDFRKLWSTSVANSDSGGRG